MAALSAEHLTRLGMHAMPVRTGIANEPLPASDEVASRYSHNAPWAEEYRKRLGSISWLMKLFKQRISYRAKAEDHCRGHFWESRCLSVPLLERGAVVACMAYVDANPFRAGLAQIPPVDPYTGEVPSCTLDLPAYGDLVNHACGRSAQGWALSHRWCRMLGDVVWRASGGRGGTVAAVGNGPMGTRGVS